MDEEKGADYDQPVAYDVQGRPLFLHSSEGTNGESSTQSVHIVRPTELDKPDISDMIKLRHERSKQLYPDLNLSEVEYVVRAVKRHPIGLFWPVFFGVIVVALLLAFLINFDVISKTLALNGTKLTYESIVIPVILLIAGTGVFVYVFYYVYTNNRFYLTNESVIQEIQTAIFTKRMQSVSLGNIEDTSYLQNSIFQQIFDYGTIRLSTIGDETTYKFTSAANPKEHLAILDNAVESFKNGRPVNGED